jgi:hypothetical protein
MMKLSLLSIFEGFFHPELPSGANSHMFNGMKAKGPVNFPYVNDDEEMLSDEEIDGEIQLELKLGRVMRDPLNLPNHNLSNGSFSNGKDSKTFGNYQLNPRGENGMDPSIDDSMLKSIEVENPDTNDDIPDEWKPYFETQKSAFAQAEKSKAKRKTDGMSLWDKAKSLKTFEIKNEDVGMREKGRAYGAPITTKQPFASGVPKATNMDFMSDDEIDRELGLMEWISSKMVYARKLHGPEADLNFFDKSGRNPYIMNTEEEFDKQQKKRTNEKKRRRPKL